MAALRFKSFAKNNGIHVKDSFLGFETRTVLLVRASVDQLSRVTESLDDLAELRKAHEVSTAITSLDGLDQRDLVDGLLERLIPPNAESPAVCVLDTGISSNHPLLKPAILNGDVHVVDPNWKLEPKNSHGTEMAGLALYGDVQQCLLDSQSVTLFHRLESVKILPDTSSNEPELYGEITAQAVLRPEVAAAVRNRAFLLAVTAPAGVKEQEKLGLPSSWSAAIDALAFGRDICVLNDQLTVLDDELNRHPRLFVISAGNIQPSAIVSTDNFLDRCDLSPVEDPAQAWNAITVGAYSAVDTMEGAPSSFDGYSPMAERGELSPVSRTSVAFNQKRWPFKPEVVADGGNLAVSPEGTSVDTPENLALVTTRRVTSSGGLLTTTRDTSAATAQVAAIAADVMAAYPKLKMETVRALVVHSAEWTPTMLKRFNAATKKQDRVNLLRRYGMGVPDRSRAIQSAANALNLLVEGTIRPFEKGTNGIRTGNMHLHTLPWPEEELLSLPPDAPVRMRVTLSYFVDPNPSRRGWTGRYRYGSYGLRFASVYPEETGEQFRKRINKLAREDNETIDSSRDDGWFFGASQQRKPGSLHTDIWEGVGADLARKGLIAVYPVEGWRKHYPQTNLVTFAVGYSLVVSIESPEVDVDLWTPVQQQIATEVETEIDTPI